MQSKKKSKTRNKSKKRPGSGARKLLLFTLLSLSLLIVLIWGCGTPEPKAEITPPGISQPAPAAEPEPEPEPELQPEPSPAAEPTPAPKQEQEPAAIPAPTPAETPVNTPESVVNNPGLEGTASQLVWSGISGGSSGGKPIALTFDAGWEYDQTRQLLDVLEQQQVRATFFLRGNWVKDHPDLAREINARGHLIGNHSLNHDHMTGMTKEQMSADIAATTGLIKQTVGSEPYLFRPPFGEYNDTLLNVLGQQGYAYTVMWTVDSHDWAESMNGVQVTEQYVIDRVLKNASARGIVLMHVGGYQTVAALPEIITGLRAAGYAPMRLDEMLPRG